MTDKLLPCPFCGADAEQDYTQVYRTLQGGSLDHAAAIYCVSCDANMTMCRADHPSLTDEERMAFLVEIWNRRAPSPQDHVVADDSLKTALEMTGCKDEADLIDMANVGNSLMERIDSLVSMPGPYHHWSPADDPAEIVFDLVNDLDELREDNTKIKAALSTPPEGFALVPLKMTAAMINAWSGGLTVSSDENAYRTTFQDAWDRVLRAALATAAKDQP